MCLLAYHSPANNLILAAGNDSQRFGIQSVLFFQYALGKRLFVIFVEHRNDSLRDDWPAIECLINKGHRATAEFDAMFQSLLLRIKTRERRQQARMNIQDAIAIG